MMDYLLHSQILGLTKSVLTLQKVCYVFWDVVLDHEAIGKGPVPTKEQVNISDASKLSH
jgi:hypothetical protein